MRDYRGLQLRNIFLSAGGTCYTVLARNNGSAEDSHEVMPIFGETGVYREAYMRMSDFERSLGRYKRKDVVVVSEDEIYSDFARLNRATRILGRLPKLTEKDIAKQDENRAALTEIVESLYAHNTELGMACRNIHN